MHAPLTLKALLGPQDPLRPHRRRRRARRRLHVGHHGAHRHHEGRLRPGLRQSSERGRRRRSSSGPTASTASSAATASRVDAAAVPRSRRRRRCRRTPPASCRASPSWSAPTATVADDGGMGVTLAANWIADDVLNPFQLVSGSRDRWRRRRGRSSTPAPPGGEGWTVGDTFTVLSSRRAPDAHAGGDRRPTAPSTAFRGVDAHRHRRRHGPGALRRAWSLRCVAGRRRTRRAGHEPLQHGLDAALADTDLRTLTADEDTQNKKDELADNLAFIDTFLMAFVYIALFVGIVHHLQHVLDRRRPAGEGPRACCGPSAPDARQVLPLGAASRRSLVGLVAAAVGIARRDRLVVRACGPCCPRSVSRSRGARW